MHVIGLDIGTTGVKALLIRHDGKIVGSGSKGYKTYSERNHVEQDAKDWWKASVFAIKEAIKGIDKRSIQAISLSTQGATMLAIDKDLNPINKAITWMDRRSIKQTEQIRESLGEDYVYQTTGWRLIPSADAAKILYMKQNSAYSAAVKYISTIEYMNLRLTGNIVIDPTNAGIRQLYNVKEGVWDKNILDSIQCSTSELPEIKPTGEFIGTLLAESAVELGLCKEVKVYNGAHDQFCASLGSGAVDVGDVLISTGTTWMVVSIDRKPLYTQTYISSCSHPVHGLFGNMVSLTGTGSSYEWIKNSVFSGEGFQEINEKCEKRIAHKKDLFYIPWLAGALYPYWIPNARGGFFGIDLSTDKYDLALSIMEATTFYVKAALEDFARNGCETRSLRIMGGATNSKLWMGILKSVLEIPIQKMSEANTCAIGAASIALCAENYFNNYKEAAAAMISSENIDDPGYSKKYFREKYTEYQKLLEHLLTYYK